MAKISKSRPRAEAAKSSAGPLSVHASYFGTSENDVAKAIDTGLWQLGEQAARKFDEEFPGWLRRFSAVLKKYPEGAQQWAKIAGKCGTMKVLIPLYLFTYPGKTSSHVFQAQFRLLTKRLDTLVRTYANALKHTRALLEGRELSWLMLVEPALHSLLKQQFDSLSVAEAQLKGLHKITKKQGSRKTDPSDETLYHLASTIRQGTGSFELFAKIATLLEVANSAHGGVNQIVDEEKVKKRFYRFRKRHKRAAELLDGGSAAPKSCSHTSTC